MSLCSPQLICSHAETISDLIKKVHVPSMSNVEWEGKTYGPPSQIPW
jgi:hypothetical protein